MAEPPVGDDDRDLEAVLRRVLGTPSLTAGQRARLEQRLAAARLAGTTEAASAPAAPRDPVPVPARPERAARGSRPARVMHSWAYGFQTMRAMAAAADLVAEGVVLSNTYVPDSPGGPVTDYAFAVERVILNHLRTADPVPERITVSAPGGPQVPDDRWVEDSVVYRDGQRLIVFLRRVGPSRYTIITAPAMSTFVVDGDQVRPFAPDHGLQDVPGATARADFLALIAG